MKLSSSKPFSDSFGMAADQSTKDWAYRSDCVSVESLLRITYDTFITNLSFLCC